MLTPKMIKALNRAAVHYTDDKFFAILIGPKWFIFNWTLGISLTYEQITNCAEFETLVDRGEQYMEDPPEHLLPTEDEHHKYDIVPHLRGASSWSDFFLGSGGIPLDADMDDLKEAESLILGERECYVFSTDSGVRYLVKKRYFDIVEDIIGPDYEPAIFRTINDEHEYPRDYRPLVYYRNSEPIAFCYATSEERLWHNHTNSRKNTMRTGRSSKRRHLDLEIQQE